MADDKDKDGEASLVSDTIQEFKLGQDEELRFEVTEGKNAVIATMVDGMAEIFGTEMVKDKPYQFMGGTKLAIFTYHGCHVIIKGKTDIAYVAKETPMLMYLNCHGALETLRRTAETDGKRGPIVLVVGPTDVGKSTVCRILINYAVRLGRRPIYVDMDVGQGSISVPGTIGAMLIERPASIEEGGFIQQAPLTYFLGFKTPTANIPLYHMILSRLAENVHERMESNRKAKSSGVIINTCGWIKGEGYKSLTHIAQAIEADVILVLDQERLYNELTRDMPAFVKVVFLPKSGGVVERGTSFRQESRDTRIREYFYGKQGIQNLHPHSFQVKFSEAKIFKIGAPAIPQSCMPLGMKGDETRTKLVAVTPTQAALLHRLLAVSFATEESEDVVRTNIAGYICVTDVDMDKGRMTVLSPQPGPLPKTLLLLSDIQFMDSQ
jgi:polyribonucleotide 5'-hydroxyl-kinase